jgi:hypothetical protein
VRQLLLDGVVRGQLSVVYDKAASKYHLIALVPKPARNAEYRRLLELRDARREQRKPMPLATFSDLGSRAMATSVTIAPDGSIVGASRYSMSQTTYRLMRQIDENIATSNALEQDTQRLQRALASPSSASSSSSRSKQDLSAELSRAKFVAQAVRVQTHRLRAKIRDTVTAKHYEIANNELRSSSVRLTHFSRGLPVLLLTAAD